MRIIKTQDLPPLENLDDWSASQIYNGFDVAVTRELVDALLPQLDEHTKVTYEFEKSLQGVILEMRLRGIAIDLERRDQVIEQYTDTIDRLEAQLTHLVGESLDIWGWNWQSPKDLREIFFDTLGIPRGVRASVDRKALERINSYFVAKPFVSHIITMRDLAKKVSMLKTEIDRDGRMRTSYNIAGTTTGRLSSSFSEFGTGTNLQNIEESLRSIFIADPGYKLAYLDANSGESRCVGAIEWNLFNDGRYLSACETGDVHTSVAKLVWPNHHWTGDLATDRKIAEQRYYRHYDRRFMCKKIGHGSNYGGRPRTLAEEAKVEVGLVEDFQGIYFRLFPAHRQWHRHVEEQLRRVGFITSLLGRKRYFLGRRDDDATLREAIAYDPQGSLADYLDRGMLSAWRDKQCQILMQIHDAILVQYPEWEEDRIVGLVRRQLEFPIQLSGGRVFKIPYGVKTGWNWGAYSEENPDGLRSYQPKDQRRRSPPTTIMDRRFRRAYGKLSSYA